jgi:hypothetical protein
MHVGARVCFVPCADFHWEACLVDNELHDVDAWSWPLQLHSRHIIDRVGGHRPPARSP